MTEQPQNPNKQPLTKQEEEVLKHIAEGEPNRQIADEMCLSPHTIKNHKANIMKKRGLTSTMQLFLYAVQWLKDKKDK